MIDSLSNNELFLKSPLSKVLHDDPLGFIDIGARGDIHELVTPLAKNVSILGFEPDPEECQRMIAQHNKAPVWKEFNLEPAGLSDSIGDKTLYRMTVPTNDSLRQVNKHFADRYNMEKFRPKGELTVKTTTLDAVLSQSRYNNSKRLGELIKLDTQGTEYEILEGADNTITKTTLGVMCEVAFGEIYSGQRLFSEVELHMRSKGFTFYGFTWLILRSQKSLDKKITTGRERYLYADAIFLKDPYETTQQILTADQKQRLVVIAILLKYYDLALELSRELWRDEELKSMTSLIENLAYNSEQESIESVETLLSNMKKNRKFSNVILSNFVKSKFGYLDCDDTIIE